jgi:predicted PurR-regulated permease PerM
METAALEEGEPGAEDEPGADEVRPSDRYSRLRSAALARGIPLPAILTTCGVVVLIYLLGKLAFRMRDVLLMILVAGFIALILNPMVLYVQRRVPRRGGAVAIVIGWATLVFIGLAFLFGDPLVTGLTHLSTKLPLYVREAADGTGPIGELVRRFHLQTWVAQNSPKLKSLGTTLAKPALDFGKGAASVLGTLVTIFALALLLMLEGPKIWSGVLSGLSPARAERWSRAAREINQSVTGYVVGDLLTSVIAGVVVFVTLLILHVPFALLWGLWVLLVDFLPMVGGALAGIPTVLFAATHSLTAGIVMAAVFVAYQQLENHVLNPLIMSKTVNVNPLVVLLSILFGTSIGDWVGGTFGGFVAALLSIPCAAALQVIFREIWQATAVDDASSTGAPLSAFPSRDIGRANIARDAIVFAVVKPPDGLCA